MAAPRGEVARVSTRRPKDRKQQIVTAAARRFCAVGYHNVSMAEIAEDVGITAGALYRHFRGKQALLHATALDASEQFAAVASTDLANLDGTLATLTTLALQRRELGVLWQREFRHLPEDAKSQIQTQLRQAAEHITATIERTQPQLSVTDADLTAWTVFAVLASASHHRVELDRATFETLLLTASKAVTRAAIGSSTHHYPNHGRTNKQARMAHSSRREALLTAATDLFNRRGFQAVGMAEIGAAAGISGPSVYNHFVTKSQMLEALLTRGNEVLQFELSRALASASTSRDALEIVLHSYIDLSLEHTDLIGLLITEVINLPDERQRRLRRIQHDYIAEWVTLLRNDRPTLTNDQAKILVHATLTAVNDISRIRHLRTRPALAHELAHFGQTILRCPINT